jgi:hypothetical protein
MCLISHKCILTRLKGSFKTGLHSLQDADARQALLEKAIQSNLSLSDSLASIFDEVGDE